MKIELDKFRAKTVLALIVQTPCFEKDIDLEIPLLSFSFFKIL